MIDKPCPHCGRSEPDELTTAEAFVAVLLIGAYAAAWWLVWGFVGSFFNGH